MKTYFYNVTVGSSIIGNSMTVEKPLLEIFKELGIKDETDAKKLIYNLRLQHALSNGGDTVKKMHESDLSSGTNRYEDAQKNYQDAYATTEDFDQFWDRKLKAYSNNGAGHADFTHQSITMATHLNPNQVQLADVYGGREHVKDLSGWEGDTTKNATDKKPSIGEDDYKADLDSVNLIGRMQKGQSYDQAISSYYADLQKDSTLREREFLKNKDWKQVRSTIYSSILPLEIMEKGEDAIKAYIESN